MFVRAVALFTVSTLAAANILVRNTPASQCGIGHLYCCNGLLAEGDPALALLAPLGIIPGPGDFLVGITCSPITIIGLGSGTCSAQPVCCTGSNNFDGLVVLGCIPLDLGI